MDLDGFRRAREEFDSGHITLNSVTNFGGRVVIEPNELLRALLFESRLCGQTAKFSLGLPGGATNDDREWFANVIASMSEGKLLPNEALSFVRQRRVLSADEAKRYGLVDEVLL